MPQQINLYSPILLTPRRHFSAAAMLQALAVLALGLAALGGWIVQGNLRLKADLESARNAASAEQKRLRGALQAPAGSPADTQALEQQLAQARARLAEHEQWLKALQAAPPTHSLLLQHLAQTVPAPVWLTDVRLQQGRIELAGMTLQPEALRPWLARLAEHPALAGQVLNAVKVERAEAADAWSFRLHSAVPATPVSATTAGGRT